MPSSSRPDDRASDSFGRHRPPPNYFSRGVQYRLMVLVGLFMLVIVLMNEAGKPKNWEWMWAGQKKQAPTPVEPDRDVNTTAPPRRAVDDSQPGTIGGGDEGPAQPDENEEADASDDESLDALSRTQLEGWRRLWKALSRPERNTLSTALRAVREKRALTTDEADRLTRLVARMNAGWTTYHDQAFMALAQDDSELPPEQKRLWLLVVEQSKAFWSQELKPALEGVVQPPPGGLTARHLEPLNRLQRMLDTLHFEQVRDNTVLRTAESDAWYRCLEKLKASELRQLESQSAGAVGFLQLYDQPQYYRNRLVTIRGTARMAYRVVAPNNLYGIDSYYIFWVKPYGGPNTPLVVYSLDLPAGFPPIKDRTTGTTMLSADVEFTGYFFKRWVYRAREGPSTAPLILAKAPRWDPTPLPTTTEVPSNWFLLSIVVVIGLLAIGIAGVVYAHSQWKSTSTAWHNSHLGEQDDTLVALAKQYHAPDVAEKLRTLAVNDEHTEGDNG